MIYQTEVLHNSNKLIWALYLGRTTAVHHAWKRLTAITKDSTDPTNPLIILKAFRKPSLVVLYNHLLTKLMNAEDRDVSLFIKIQIKGFDDLAITTLEDLKTLDNTFTE